MEDLDKEVTSKDKKEVLLNAYQKFTEFLNAARELTDRQVAYHKTLN
jgi:hypothetical protein|uniref:Uncharacterized protein n=1 Tax=Myoviridae sp. ctPuP5 TaxID=2823543 RepID=A0A8S5L9V0_9CAUD|nr:MAG TPA: hypothetical protein [Myoviridae sp. ctPuP5]